MRKEKREKGETEEASGVAGLRAGPSCWFRRWSLGLLGVGRGRRTPPSRRKGSSCSDFLLRAALPFEASPVRPSQPRSRQRASRAHPTTKASSSDGGVRRPRPTSSAGEVALPPDHRRGAARILDLRQTDPAGELAKLRGRPGGSALLAGFTPAAVVQSPGPQPPAGQSPATG